MANENLQFRCADAGHPNCSWQTTGRNEEEIMQRVREHGSEHHGITDWTEDVKNRVKNAIKRMAA